ncbi:MAG: SDR family oxidoreductase [Cyanophyceae cyanobacterium]
MQKLLVTGASGFLGWHLCRRATDQWQVIGTTWRQRVEIPGVCLIRVDLRHFKTLQELFAHVQPAAVIHTAAMSKPNACQQSPEAAYSINVTASLNLARLCAEARIPVVFTSTDLVFDGHNPPYSETAPVSPLNIYGEQKVAAEQGILKRSPRAVICRLPLLFGAATPSASSFMQPLVAALKAGQELRLFTDEFRTPVSAATAADGLLLALNTQGILHLGGKDRVSRYQFGCLIAEVFGLSQANISPCRQRDIPMAAPRAADVSLDSSKAFSLGYRPLPLQEQLKSLLEQ